MKTPTPIWEEALTQITDQLIKTNNQKLLLGVIRDIEALGASEDLTRAVTVVGEFLEPYRIDKTPLTRAEAKAAINKAALELVIEVVGI